MVEAGRDPKRKRDKCSKVDAWQRFLQNDLFFSSFIFFIYWQVELFYFYSFFFCWCVNYYFFFVCLVSVNFFFIHLLYFTLFYFLLIFTVELALSFALFVYCYLLLFFCCCLIFLLVFYFVDFLFFYLHGFSVVFFFFQSLIALGTSSLCLVMFALGVGCTAPPFRGRVSKGSKLCNWWFGKVRGLINKIWWIWYFEETVDDGVGRTMPRRGAESGCSPLWLFMAGRSGRWCQLFCFYPFENPWRLLAGCWNGEKVLAQLLPGWNYGARGHVCCDPSPPMRVSSDATHKQLLRLMMLTIAGSPLGMENCWG